MKKLLFYCLFAAIHYVFCFQSFAQVGINTTGSQPDPSAGLDVNFTNKGFLPPRMTYEQRKSIASPAEGLLVWCTNCNPDGTGVLSMYQGGIWKNLDFHCAAPQTPAAGTYTPTSNSINWNWGTAPIADGYKGNSENDYNTAIDLGPVTSLNETGLQCQRSYTRYIWAYNACGHSEVPLAMTQSTLPVLLTPSPAPDGTTASACQIHWKWSSVPGATGYKWNSVNDLNTATDLGPGLEYFQNPVGGGMMVSSYVWAYNSCGYSNPTILTCQASPDFCVGQSYQGGIIIYVDNTGQHGLIAATNDLATMAHWSMTSGVTGATNSGVGEGLVNTNIIVVAVGSSDIYAAKLCADLVLNGYSDWYLPSKEEMMIMYDNRYVLGNWGEGMPYWSSTEINAGNAGALDMLTGLTSISAKQSVFYVRPVRLF